MTTTNLGGQPTHDQQADIIRKLIAENRRLRNVTIWTAIKAWFTVPTLDTDCVEEREEIARLSRYVRQLRLMVVTMTVILLTLLFCGASVSVNNLNLSRLLPIPGPSLLPLPTDTLETISRKAKPNDQSACERLANAIQMEAQATTPMTRDALFHAVRWEVDKQDTNGQFEQWRKVVSERLQMELPEGDNTDVMKLKELLSQLVIGLKT